MCGGNGPQDQPTCPLLLLLPLSLPLPINFGASASPIVQMVLLPHSKRKRMRRVCLIYVCAYVRLLVLGGVEMSRKFDVKCSCERRCKVKNVHES